MADQWRKIPDAAKRCGISTRTLREYLKMGLPHVRMPTGTILIKDEAADDFFKQFEIVIGSEVNQIVDEVLEGIGNGN